MDDAAAGSAADATSPAVLVERRDTVLLVILNRPEQRNAVNAAVAEGVARALDLLDSTPELRVGVLAGAGTGFCAGMDLKAFARGESAHAADRGFAGIVERPPRKPLIAAVEGFALAGGLEIALACDLTVVARGALLGIPEVKRGLVAAGGALLRLPERLPLPLVKEMAFTGEPIDAERAAALGLVNRLVEPGDAVRTALELAVRIAANHPLAVEASKQVLVDAPEWPADQRWARQREIVEPVRSSSAAREGALAFSERRAPAWGNGCHRSRPEVTPRGTDLDNR